MCVMTDHGVRANQYIFGHGESAVLPREVWVCRSMVHGRLYLMPRTKHKKSYEAMKAYKPLYKIRVKAK